MPVLPTVSDGTLGKGKVALTHHKNAERSSAESFFVASIAAESSALTVFDEGSSGTEAVADGCAVGDGGASLDCVEW